MILGLPSITPPFDVPGICWAQTGFATADVTDLFHDGPFGPVTLSLPPTLLAAVPKRRSEFLAGRLCAALALRQAGLSEEVGQEGRAPVWPAGVAGSITHSRNRALAAVSTRHAALGIDCEALVTQDRATQLAAAIFTEAEQRLCPPALTFGQFFTLVFSAKEALYKALSPRLAYVPAFLDVTLTALDPQGMDLQLEAQTYRARFVTSANDCLTLVAL